MQISYFIIYVIFIAGFVSCRQDKVHAPIVNQKNIKKSASVMRADDAYPNKKFLGPQATQKLTPLIVIPVEHAVNPANSNTNPAGGIFATKKKISSGDEYLQFLAEGHASAPLTLKADQIKNIDLKRIRADGKLLDYVLPNRKIVDSTHAYARAMDVPISNIADIRCRGVFEDSDCFVVFFGLESDSLENFQFTYNVNKRDGQVFYYYNNRGVIQDP